MPKASPMSQLIVILPIASAPLHYTSPALPPGSDDGVSCNMYQSPGGFAGFHQDGGGGGYRADSPVLPANTVPLMVRCSPRITRDASSPAVGRRASNHAPPRSQNPLGRTRATDTE